MNPMLAAFIADMLVFSVCGGMFGAWQQSWFAGGFIVAALVSLKFLR